MENLFGQIEALSEAKGIDPQVVIDALKDAIVVAARKNFKTGEELVADFNTSTGQVEVFAVKTVVELVANPAKEIGLAEAQRTDPDAEIGGEVRFLKPTGDLGRIPAQVAKQVIFQKIREAEREVVYKEYSGRLGEIVPCTVKRSEGADLIVDLGRTEARLPRSEQSRLESFSPGDRVRVVIKALEKAGRGPTVIASRTSDELVKTLFEQEVPEIYDGTVRIVACAREAGERTKIAVQSGDRDVDAVGACVGMKGMRVQSIIRELRGEKIDIIPYFDEPAELATRALSPANISRVTIINAAQKHLEVVVDDSQLSLAIGKKGQNVRLAAKLMGWRIDIKSEEQKRQEVESAMEAMVGGGTPVSVLTEHGLGEKLVDKLLDAGSSTVEQLADMTPEQLEGIPGIGPKMVEKITVAVSSYFAQFEVAAEELAVESVEQVPATEPQPEPPPDALAAAPATMPGMPVEGEDVDDSPLPGEEESEDFDTMVSSSFVEGQEESESQTAGETAAVQAAETAAGKVDETPPAEGEKNDVIEERVE